LAEPQLFHAQLRAILRASHYGNVRLMIPMLSSIPEVNQSLHMIQVAKQSLLDDGIPFDNKIQIGGMIEIPAAALTARAFAEKLDFLSIGTNDLIQYTLAIDRTDDTVSHLYDPMHPAVLQLVAHTIKTANQLGVPVSVCGEMAGDAAFTRMLLGFGLRTFSMHPTNLLSVKQKILKSDIPSLEGPAAKLLKVNEPERMHQLLARLNS
jgi:phosphotransferase system enzyme I (PtsI)